MCAGTAQSGLKHAYTRYLNLKEVKLSNAHYLSTIVARRHAGHTTNTPAAFRGTDYPVAAAAHPSQLAAHNHFLPYMERAFWIEHNVRRDAANQNGAEPVSAANSDWYDIILDEDLMCTEAMKTGFLFYMCHIAPRN